MDGVRAGGPRPSVPSTRAQPVRDRGCGPGCRDNAGDTESSRLTIAAWVSAGPTAATTAAAGTNSFPSSGYGDGDRPEPLVRCRPRPAREQECQASPQSGEAAVEHTMPTINTRRHPSRSAPNSEQKQDGEGDCVGTYHPLQALLRKAEVRFKRGQRDDHDRRVGDDHEEGAAKQGERPPATGIENGRGCQNGSVRDCHTKLQTRGWTGITPTPAKSRVSR